KVRVNIDYHVEIEGHYYSVPHQLCGQQLDARISADCIECFQQRKRVSSHVRSFQKGRHTTVVDHMPRGHREYADWTPERLIRWAAQTGSKTAAMTEAIMASRQHAQQAFRSAMGLIQLGKVYTPERLEAACDLALEGQATSYKSVKSILKTGLDQQPRQQNLPITNQINHNNIRGGHYYH
ncbi:MAG: transposase, partial [Desulfuromusa sp.]|nr:transposase [Desulfuromusa sp.]